MAQDDRTTQTVFAGHSGIWYEGELIRAPRWDATLGVELASRAHFRVVLLDEPMLVDVSQIQDGRIAVAMPDGPAEDATSDEAEARLLREARATYAARDEQASRAVDERRAWLTAHAAASRGARLQRGTLLGAPPLDLDLATVFGGHDERAWASRIGAALLHRAYPELTIDARGLTRPIWPANDAPRLFELAREARGFPDPADPGLRAIAQALGILPGSEGEAHGLLLGEVLRAAEARPGARAHRLIHVQGVPHDLAVLGVYLLPLVGRDVLLSDMSERVTANGAPLPRNRIAVSDLANCRWDPNLLDLVEAIETSEPAPSLDREALTAMRIDPQTPAREAMRSVGAWVHSARARLPEVRSLIEELVAAQGRPAPSRARRALARVTMIAEAEDAVTAIQRTLADAGPAVFRKAMDVWHGWCEEAGHGRRLVETLAWYGRLDLGSASDGITVEYAALQGRLNDPQLVMIPRLWQVLADADGALRERFAAAYVRQHAEQNMRIEASAKRIEEAALRSSALAWLNTLPQLGPVQGIELPGLIADLRPLVHACDEPLDAAAVAEHGTCRACRMSPGDTPLADEVERVSAYVDQALEQRCRRLSSLLAQRLVGDGGGRNRLEQLMQLVQISDLTGLANVLDREVTEFIRLLLDEPARVPAHA